VELTLVLQFCSGPLNASPWNQYQIFKVENNVYYRKGEAKGKTKGKAIGKAEGIAIGEENKSHLFVEYLITKSCFPNEEAAKVADVDVAYVIKVRQELKL